MMKRRRTMKRRKMMKRRRKVEHSGLDFGTINPAKCHSISEYPHPCHQ